MSVYTGNPALGQWVSVTLPDDISDPKDTASVNVPLAAHSDKLAWLEYGNSVVFGTLPSRSGGPGQKVFVDLRGWYSWAAASPFGAADGQYVVTITATGGGVWMWEHCADHSANRLPLIGPAPGDASIYPTTTSAGRLNKALIDHGYHYHLINTVFNTSVTTTSDVSSTLFFEDVGVLQGDDIVDCQIDTTAMMAWDGSGSYNGGYLVSIEFSEDGGFTWIVPVFRGYSAPTTEDRVVLTRFARKVNNPGDFQIRIRGYVLHPGGHETLTLKISSWHIKVTRP